MLLGFFLNHSHARTRSVYKASADPFSLMPLFELSGSALAIIYL